CDECSLCYTQLWLWKSIKQYPSEIVGQSYWSTPDNEQWDEINETEPCFYEPLPLEPLFGQQLEDLYTQQPITHVQINYYNIQTEYPLTNIPWWLPPLETPSQHLLNEYNNLLPTHLCNYPWWTTPDITSY